MPRCQSDLAVSLRYVSSNNRGTASDSLAMNKKALTVADVRSKFITPAICGANGEKWDLMTQIREEAYFTKGRVIVRGKTVKRGDAKKADYILSYKPIIPLAVVEVGDQAKLSLH
jgi:type I site-specific restriction endonuclease